MTERARTLADCTRALLTDLVKAALLAETRTDLAAHWRREAAARQAEWLALHDAAPETHPDLGGLWALAIEDAGRDRDVWEHANVSATLTQDCPLSWQDLLAQPLDFDTLASRLRASTATG